MTNTELEILESIQEHLKGGEDVYIRILTRQEMVDKGLIIRDEARPRHWNSYGDMDYLFGANNIRVLRVAYDWHGEAQGIHIRDDVRDRDWWYIKSGYFELVGTQPSKVTLDDIKDFITSKLNKPKT